MIATQRRRHLLTWLVLGPLILAMLALAVVYRPAPGLPPATELAETSE